MGLPNRTVGGRSARPVCRRLLGGRPRGHGKYRSSRPGGALHQHGPKRVEAAPLRPPGQRRLPPPRSGQTTGLPRLAPSAILTEILDGTSRKRKVALGVPKGTLWLRWSPMEFTVI